MTPRRRPVPGSRTPPRRCVLRSVFSQSWIWRGKGAVFQEEPGLIEDEQGGLAVEAALERVKERAEHRPDRGGLAHEIVHLEGLHAQRPMSELHRDRAVARKDPSCV